MIDRCYIEITNICNLNCVFCPGHDREPRQMSPEEFDLLTDKLQGRVRFLFFHLMGEPLLNPHLPVFVSESRQKGFIPVITTNGTLFDRHPALADSRPYKVNISLHSFEGNRCGSLDDYMSAVADFASSASQHGTIVVLRLWNQGGYDTENEMILAMLKTRFPEPWTIRPDGYRISERIYIEYDRMFEWPDSRKSECGAKVFCYALRNQIGVLADGTVVPCCLDHNGEMPLGNLFAQSLDEILGSARARRIYEGFSSHNAVEPLCRRCGYANQTKQFRAQENDCQ